MLLAGVKHNRGIPAFRLGGAVAYPGFLGQIASSSQGQHRKTEPAVDVLILKCLQFRITNQHNITFLQWSNSANHWMTASSEIPVTFLSFRIAAMKVALKTHFWGEHKAKQTNKHSLFVFGSEWLTISITLTKHRQLACSETFNDVVWPLEQHDWPIISPVQPQQRRWLTVYERGYDVCHLYPKILNLKWYESHLTAHDNFTECNSI